MKVFYHNDADGKCAGNIVYRDMLDRGLDPAGAKFIAIDYTDTFPMEDIYPGETVMILDFSIDPELMVELLAITKNVIWVDHHKSSLEKYADCETLSGVEILGLRSTDLSGCELTWLHHMTGLSGHMVHLEASASDVCPRHVRLIGDRDTWTYRYGDDSSRFHEAWKYAGEPGPEDDWWANLDDDRMKSLLDTGEILCDHTDAVNKAIIDKWAYEAEFEGHRILVCNAPIFTSTLFGDRFFEYPFVAMYCHTGVTWKISLYADKMDVVDIAQKYGGGGHPRACGFVAEELPFKKI